MIQNKIPTFFHIICYFYIYTSFHFQKVCKLFSEYIHFSDNRYRSSWSKGRGQRVKRKRRWIKIEGNAHSSHARAFETEKKEKEREKERLEYCVWYRMRRRPTKRGEQSGDDLDSDGPEPLATVGQLSSPHFASFFSSLRCTHKSRRILSSFDRRHLSFRSFLHASLNPPSFRPYSLKRTDQMGLTCTMALTFVWVLFEISNCASFNFYLLRYFGNLLNEARFYFHLWNFW